MSKVRRLLFGSLSFKGVLFRIFFTGLVALLAYMLYLDSRMQATFSQMTQVRAIEIQARPLAVQPGMVLAKSDLAAELKALRYEKVARVYQPGQFAESSTKLEVFLRADASLPAGASRRVMIRFDGHLVDSMRSEADQVIRGFTLPPVTLSKLWPGKQEERQPVLLEQVPESLIKLLLWVEDRDFYQHFGVNPMAIARALIVNLKAGRTVQGGSTLTQQLAKNLLLTRERSLTRKINEALLALLMEWHFSKEQILQAYINEVYLGQSGSTAIHGFASASEFYFGKPLAKLTLEQQVMLVAMVKGPSLYHPWRRAEKLTQRRDILLSSLLEQEQITTEQYLAATQAPLGVLKRGKLGGSHRPALTSLVKQELAQRAGWQLSEINTVQTTLDPLSQAAMEEVAQTTLDQLESQYQVTQLQVAMLAVDINSGAVRGLVSDRNPSYPGFNRVRDANRPIGSLLKPFILLTALQEKPEMNLATQLNDRPVSMLSEKGKRWQPQNFDRQYRGSVTAVEALSKSLNVPFVNLGMTVGLDKVRAKLQQVSGYSLDSLYPSDLLGSMSMTPWQVAQLYSPIANQGVHQPLHLVSGIHAQQTQFELMEPATEVLIEPVALYLLQYALHHVVEQGTARKLGAEFSGIPLAGKTGTTNEYRDAWFVGIDGRELMVIWIGRDDNEPIRLTGSKAAMKVYQNYLAKRGPLPFEPQAPDSVQMAHFDDKGRPVAQGCPFEHLLPAATDNVMTQLGCEAVPDDETRKKQDSWWSRIFKAR